MALEKIQYFINAECGLFDDACAPKFPNFLIKLREYLIPSGPAIKKSNPNLFQLKVYNQAPPPKNRTIRLLFYQIGIIIGTINKGPSLIGGPVSF